MVWALWLSEFLSALAASTTMTRADSTGMIPAFFHIIDSGKRLVLLA